MSEVLSQSQIDALLSSLTGAGDAGESEAKEEKKEIHYRKYDFFSPRKFTKDRLKIVRSIYDNYARIAASQINSLFRTTSEVEVITVEEQRYYEFNNALADSDILTLIKVTLPEQAKNLPILVYISPAVMVNMIDRMMGGTGDDDTVEAGYAYTELEGALYEKIMKYFINITRDAWSAYIRIDAELERVEYDTSMFRDIGMDETVVIVTLSVDMDGISGNLNLCIPGNLLTDMFQVIDKRKNVDYEDLNDLKDSREEIMSRINISRLGVSAQLGKVGVRLDDIYNLQVGDVIDMSKSKDSEVTLLVEGKPWFTGKLGVHKKNMAVKLGDRTIENIENKEEIKEV